MVRVNEAVRLLSDNNFRINSHLSHPLGEDDIISSSLQWLTTNHAFPHFMFSLGLDKRNYMGSGTTNSISFKVSIFICINTLLV